MNFFIYLVVIFITGMVSLIYQVVWQRYLSIMVGSEASSATMVISIFLLGMSIGYFLFGRLSKKINDRTKLLKLYGYAELATGLYAVIFPTIFSAVFMADSLNTSNFFVGFLITLIFILPPTILMGATVPIMTAVIPNKNSYINRSHAVIYGVNTLGAFIGVALGSLFMIQYFGLELSMINAGAVNILISFVYIFNKLKGPIEKEDKIEIIPQELSNKELYLYAFLSGVAVLGLEIVWIRILGLAIGSSLVVFPIVLSVFILGIGLSSLTLKEIKADTLRKNLLIGLFGLVVNFILIPFLPRLAIILRASLSDMPHIFHIYYILCFLFLCLFILPVIIPLGRILPLAYAYLRKDEREYGQQCGVMYAYNTLGTMLGSIVLGYLILNFVNLDTVFKIILFMISIGLMYLSSKQGRKVEIFLALVLTSTCLFMKWDRSDQLRGLFRHDIVKSLRNSRDLGKLNNSEKEKSKLTHYYFNDGPSATVAVVGIPSHKGLSKSIMVNGKSDSSTIGDYSTISLLAILPTIYAENTEKLNTAVVGLGTGVTAGLLGALDRVSRVDVSEISSEIIEAQKFFAEENFQLNDNKKINVEKTDAFNFFRNKKNVYDVVISEPTNPWTIGVENLFTSYFYKSVNKSLTRNGIFVQWVQSYSTSTDIFSSVIKTVKEEFKYISLYKTHEQDYAVIASNSPLSPKHISHVMNEPHVREVYKNINIRDPSEILLYEKFDSKSISVLTANRNRIDHEIFNPQLSLLALNSFFFGGKINIDTLVNPYLARIDSSPAKAIGIPKARLEELSNRNCSSQKHQFHLDLSCINKDLIDAKVRIESDNKDVALKSYSILRKYNHVGKDLGLIEEVLNSSKSVKSLVSAYRELLKEGEFLRAEKYLQTTTKVNKTIKSFLYSELNKIKKLRENYRSFGSR